MTVVGLLSERFARTEMILGHDCMERLRRARVILFGIGGVGSYAAEALVRSGIGAIDIVDNDTVSESNINRQLIALSSSIGMKKCLVEEQRIKDINPECTVRSYDVFLSKDTLDTFDLKKYDYVIDAIDTVSSKLLLIEKCSEVSVPIICCMGTGNKLDPARFRVSDIYETSGCPLARVMRRELRKKGIQSLKVVFSDEEPHGTTINTDGRKAVPGSISFVPPVAGMIMAGEVIRDLAGVSG